MPVSPAKFLSLVAFTTVLSGAALAQSDRDASFLPPAPTVPAAAPAVAAAPVAPAPVVAAPAPVVVTPVTTPAIVAPPASKSATGSVTLPVPSAVAATPPAPPAPPAPATMPVAQSKPVEKSGLGDIDPQSIGLLSANDGGLGAAMWKGTSRVALEKLLPVLSLPLASAARNDLAKRFLLTTAGVPEPTSKNTMKQDLVALRLERLVALGDIIDVWKMVQLAKPEQVDDITLRMVVESALATDIPDACEKLPDLMKGHTAPEWQQSLIVCQLRGKDTKAAELSLDLLRSQGIKDDTFFTLVEKNVINAAKQLPRQMTPLKPLNLALAVMSQLPLPGEVYSHPSAALIPVLAKTTARDDKSRLLMVERAAANGTLSTADLGTVYKGLTFDPAGLSNPAAAGNLDGAHMRALLYQAALQDKTPQGRINDAVRFIQITDTTLLNGSAAGLLAEMVDGITPTSDYATSAPIVSLIFMLAGKPNDALEWLKQARIAAASTPSIAAELASLWPIIVFSGLESDSRFDANMNEWLDGALKVGDEHTARDRASIALLLLDALGYTVTQDNWARVEDTPTFEKRPTPPALLLQRLRDAATGERRGEAVLLSLILAGGNSGDTQPISVVETVHALHETGLTADAGLIAREAALTLLFSPARPATP